jgi:NodT family efflux transporter outer membrane factor (OMF) lipoprotein
MLDNGGREFSRDHIRSPMRASASRILCVFACVCVFCWRAFWAENNGFLAVLALAHADVHRGGWVRRCLLSRAHTRASALLKIVALTLAGCTIGPNYSPEPAPVPTHYKELKGWKRAQPSDEVARGDWWKVYKDRALDQLLPQIEVSNQTVAAAAAAYEQARAIVREAQAALFPVATAGYTVTRTRTGPLAIGGSTNVGTVSNPRGRGAIYSTTYTVPISATWDLDVWGRLRRQIEANTSGAQASAADLDNAKLAAQAQLAIAYFNLRTSDSLITLLMRTIVEYKKTYEIVNNQFKAGYAVTAGDVATADAQIATTEAQLSNARLQRAQFEHAIAILTGRPPAELGVGPRNLAQHIPKTPLTVPSVLLERRPDIAAAERTMEQQNALIGVAEAAWFPDVSLSAIIQYIGPIPLPLSAARSVASLSASAAETLFNGGLTAAQVDAARAGYWQSIANYRQTVLTAFQQVEDQLAAIRYLSAQVAQLRRAVADQRQAVDVFLNQFRAGTTAFTTVVVAEVQLLADEEAELTARQNLFLASVNLIVALGGGWDIALLPTQGQLQRDFSLLPQLESQPSPVGTIPSDILVPPPLAPPPGAQ